MDTSLKALPLSYKVAIGIILGFLAFMIYDQVFWWDFKEDYSFGFIVPLFVAYVVYDRWPRIRSILFPNSRDQLSETEKEAFEEDMARVQWVNKITPILNPFMILSFLGGMVFFGAGMILFAAQANSLIGSSLFAIGFAALSWSLIYFVTDKNAEGGVMTFPERWRLLCYLLFPGLVWCVSAPLVFEGAVSIFLLNKVATVVEFVFGLIGKPVIRDGNVLQLPEGQVGVAEACSGIRSLTACIFAGSFLAAVFLNRLWKKIALVITAMAFAFLTNLGRSLFLTAWAYENGADSISGPIHDYAGYVVLGLTCIGLLALIPLFNIRLELEDDSDDAEPIESNSPA